MSKLKEIIVNSIDLNNKQFTNTQDETFPVEPRTAYLVKIGDPSTEHKRYVSDDNGNLSIGKTGIDKIVPGENIIIDDSDPDNPIISSTFSSDGVQLLIGGNNIGIDSSNPKYPIINFTGVEGISSIQAGRSITLDNTQPTSPKISVEIEDSTPSPVFKRIVERYSMMSQYVIDENGNIFGVTGNDLSKEIIRITPTGSMSSFVTLPSAGNSIVQDNVGNFFVKSLNHIVYKITPDAVITVVAEHGRNGKSIVVDTDGNVYTNSSVHLPGGGTGDIYKTNVATGVTTVFPQERIDDLFLDSSNNLYAVTYNTENIIKITQSGIVTEIPAIGQLTSIVVNNNTGDIYAINSTSNNIYKITPLGVITIVGNGGSQASTLSIDSDGSVYAISYSPSSIRKITSTGVSTLIPTGKSRGRKVMLDSAKNMYVLLDGLSTLIKVTQAGVVTTIVAVSDEGGIGKVHLDSLGNKYIFSTSSTKLKKYRPNGTSDILYSDTEYFSGACSGIDNNDNLYFVNRRTNKLVKITPGEVITEVLIGEKTSKIAIDSLGNVYISYVSYSGNNYIRKVSTNGVVSTITAQSFNVPDNITIDSFDNVYVWNRETDSITKVTTSGISSIFASGVSGYPSSSYNLYCCKKDNSIFVLDSSNKLCYKITSDGVKTEIRSLNFKTLFFDKYDNAYTAINNNVYRLYDDLTFKLLYTTPLPNPPGDESFPGFDTQGRLLVNSVYILYSSVDNENYLTFMDNKITMKVLPVYIGGKNITLDSTNPDVIIINNSLNNSYSTDEKLTGGKWVNDKRIYTLVKLTTAPDPANIETRFPDIIVGQYSILKYTKTTD